MQNFEDRKYLQEIIQPYMRMANKDEVENNKDIEKVEDAAKKAEKEAEKLSKDKNKKDLVIKISDLNKKIE